MELSKESAALEGPDFTEPDDLADVILVVDGQELYTSRYMLASISPRFREMFSYDNLPQAELPHRLQLTDVTVDAVQDMLTWMMSTPRLATQGETGAKTDGEFDAAEDGVSGFRDPMEAAEQERRSEEDTDADEASGGALKITQGSEQKKSQERDLDYWGCRIRLTQNYKITQLFDDYEFQVMEMFKNTPETVDARLPYIPLIQIYELDGLRKLVTTYFSTVPTEALESATLYSTISPKALCEINKLRAQLLESRMIQTDEVGLVVEGREITASRAILSKASPAFKSMLAAETWAEGNIAKIYLPGKSYDAVQYMVDYLDGQLKSEGTQALTESLLGGVALIANEYGLGNLKDECRKYMMQELDGMSDANHWMEYFYISQIYDIPEVYKRTTRELKECKLKTLQASPHYKLANMIPLLELRIAKLESAMGTLKMSSGGLDQTVLDIK